MFLSQMEVLSFFHTWAFKKCFLFKYRAMSHLALELEEKIRFCYN